jgi:aryl-alcohol dehydrogenase-like predicted oxidoreductase
MNIRSLGPDAPSAPVVGLGGMPLSLNDRPDEATAIGVVHAVLDAGVTLLDTADVYGLDHTDIGHNERLFARAVATWSGDRDPVILATKGGLARPEGRWERAGHPDHLRSACEASLAALDTDCIDLYQLHAPDPDVPFAESVGALAELRDAGKVRWVGLSNVSVDQIREARSIVPVQTVQNRLNPYFREAIDEGVVAYCAEQGIGFLAYSPVGGGRLHKKLPDHPVVTQIAAARGAEPHEVVLAWVLAQGESVFIIPGARTSDHALSSIRAGELTLSENELRALDDAEFSTA